MQSLALITIVGCFRLELWFTKSRALEYKTISGTLRYLSLWYVFVRMCSIASLIRWMLTPKLSVTAITIHNSDTKSTLGVELVVYWMEKIDWTCSLMRVELGTSWVKGKCPIQKARHSACRMELRVHKSYCVEQNAGSISRGQIRWGLEDNFEIIFHIS